MSDLLKAEFLRLASRRLTLVLVVLTMLLGALIPISSSNATRPVDDSDWQRAHQAYAQDRTMYDEDCGSPAAGCEEFWGEPADYVRVPVNYEDYTSASLMLALFVLIAATVLASALVGSEFTAGSLSTQLTFTPKRLHVMAAKVVAATTGAVALVSLYVVTVLVIGTLTFVLLRGAGDVAAEPDLPLQVLRLLVVTFFVAALASSLTFGLGSSVLTIAAGFFFLVVSEVTMTSLPAPPHWLARLLPTPNLIALLDDGFQYSVWDRETLVATRVVDFGDALLYATLLVMLVAAVSAGVFRRRDLLR